MTGCLYIVSTPIGNLGDITLRAIEVIKSADIIAAEDTRVTLKLLNHLGIKKTLYSYHRHNQIESGENLVQLMLEGKSVALISDAGTPTISDPGESLVQICADRGIRIIPLPGACAAITALSVSGISAQRFCFEGFLSLSKKNRREHLEGLKTERRAMVFYEAPHKLMQTLKDLCGALGDRRIAVCREMTKIHEEIIRGDISDAIAHFTDHAPRGEMVLVIEGAPEGDRSYEMPLEDAVELVRKYRAEGLSIKEAARRASAETGYSKNELYDLAVDVK